MEQIVDFAPPLVVAFNIIEAAYSGDSCRFLPSLLDRTQVSLCDLDQASADAADLAGLDASRSQLNLYARLSIIAEACVKHVRQQTEEAVKVIAILRGMLKHSRDVQRTRHLYSLRERRDFQAQVDELTVELHNTQTNSKNREDQLLVVGHEFAKLYSSKLLPNIAPKGADASTGQYVPRSPSRVQESLAHEFAGKWSDFLDRTPMETVLQDLTVMISKKDEQLFNQSTRISKLQKKYIASEKRVRKFQQMSNVLADVVPPEHPAMQYARRISQDSGYSSDKGNRLQNIHGEAYAESDAVVESVWPSRPSEPTDATEPFPDLAELPVEFNMIAHPVSCQSENNGFEPATAEVKEIAAVAQFEDNEPPSIVQIIGLRPLPRVPPQSSRSPLPLGKEEIAAVAQSKDDEPAVVEQTIGLRPLPRVRRHSSRSPLPLGEGETAAIAQSKDSEPAAFEQPIGLRPLPRVRRHSSQPLLPSSSPAHDHERLAISGPLHNAATASSPTLHHPRPQYAVGEQNVNGICRWLAVLKDVSYTEEENYCSSIMPARLDAPCSEEDKNHVEANKAFPSQFVESLEKDEEQDNDSGQGVILSPQPDRVQSLTEMMLALDAKLDAFQTKHKADAQRSMTASVSVQSAEEIPRDVTGDCIFPPRPQPRTALLPEQECFSSSPYNAISSSKRLFTSHIVHKMQTPDQPPPTHWESASADSADSRSQDRHVPYIFNPPTSPNFTTSFSSPTPDPFFCKPEEGGQGSVAFQQALKNGGRAFALDDCDEVIRVRKEIREHSFSALQSNGQGFQTRAASWDEVEQVFGEESAHFSESIVSEPLNKYNHAGLSRRIASKVSTTKSNTMVSKPEYNFTALFSTRLQTLPRCSSVGRSQDPAPEYEQDGEPDERDEVSVQPAEESSESSHEDDEQEMNDFLEAILGFVIEDSPVKQDMIDLPPLEIQSDEEAEQMSRYERWQWLHSRRRF